MSVFFLYLFSPLLYVSSTVKENGDEGGGGGHINRCIIGLAAVGRQSTDVYDTLEQELQSGQKVHQGEGSSL